MSSTCCQPLLKRSGSRNRLASPQIRDHLPHILGNILHSHLSLFNPHTTSPTPIRTQSLSTFPPTSSVPSYSSRPTLKILRPRISSHTMPSLTTQNISATISTLQFIASIMMGTFLSCLSIGLILLMISWLESEGFRAALCRRGVVLVWKLVRAADFLW